MKVHDRIAFDALSLAQNGEESFFIINILDFDKIRSYILSVKANYIVKLHFAAGNMHSKNGMTKKELVVETLRNDIRNNNFPGGTLPATLELADHFKVSIRTIDLALKQLREEGLIRGVRGTGIFINNEPQDVSNLTSRLILQVSPRDTFHNSEPYQSLRREIFSRGYFPVNLPPLAGGDGATLIERASMTQLLRAPIKGVVYHGASYWREPFLENFRNLRSVCMVRYDAENEPPGSCVLTDFFEGGRIMVKHLIEGGAKRIALLFHWRSFDVPNAPQYLAGHPDTRTLQGACEMAKEFGLPEPAGIYSTAPDVVNGFDWKALCEFDGLLCASDLLAYRAVEELEKLGVRTPEDVLICGQQETIWSSGCGREITTYSPQPEKLSRIAVDLLESGGREIVMLKPELIIRKSTMR